MDYLSKVEFSEDVLWEIVNGDHIAAQIVSNDNYKDDWFMYHEIVFAYEGVHYFFVYKEHTSPNILHKEIVKEAISIENQPVSIDSEEEARFIWKELMKKGKRHMSVDDIQDVTDLQYQYLIKLGLA